MKTPEARECYRVGDLFLDVGAMQVFREDEALHLPPLSFDLLTILVRRAPDVVSQDELLRTAWRGVVVGQETIKQRIKLLREALEDSSTDPRYIATIRGRGYRLIPEVEPVPGRDDGRGRLRSRLKAILARAPWNGAKALFIGTLFLLTYLAVGRLGMPAALALDEVPAVCRVSSAATQAAGAALEP